MIEKVVFLARRICFPLCVPDLAWHIISVNIRLLKEHVQTSLILGKWVTGNLVDKRLQSGSSLLNESFLIDTVVAAKRHLPFQRLAREGRHHNLAISLQFIS